MPSLPFWLTDLPATGFVHGVVVFCSLLLLEAVLSADNAVALASLVRHVEPDEERQRILNLGLITALLLRVVSVAAAGLVMRQPLVRILAGGYLIWLSASHFQNELQCETTPEEHSSRIQVVGVRLVVLVGLTDLAFSLDSVSAALGVTDQLPFVVLAGGLGVVLLRFTAAWMLSWMDRFRNLQNAGYLTVLTVGLRLVAGVMAPEIVPAEPVLLALIAILLCWGFSGTRISES